MGFYRAEWGIRSHLVALVGAFVVGVVTTVAGFFLGGLCVNYYSPGNEGSLEGISYFLFYMVPLTIIGTWLGQVAGCALALRLLNYERVGLTSLLLFLLVPVGFFLSVANCYAIITFFTQQVAPGSVQYGPPLSLWWMLPCSIPMLLMPVLARTIALAKRRPRSQN